MLHKALDKLDKSVELGHCAPVDIKLISERIAQHSPKTLTITLGTRDNLLERGIAYAASRIIDDTLDGFFISRVDYHTVIGDDVLDFLALEKLGTTHDTIRHIVVTEFLLEDAALRIGAIQDGKIAVVAPLVTHNTAYGLGHHGSLFPIAVELAISDLVAIVVAAEDILVNLILIVLHQTVGGIHYLGRRTVVALQLEDMHVFVNTLEIKYIVNLRTSEGIDTLVVVAHYAYLLVLAGEQQHYLLLHRIGILILVDQHVLEPVGVASADILVVFEQEVGMDEQIVEIHGVGLAQTVLICSVNLISLVYFGEPVPVAQLGIVGILLGQYQAVLGP